MWHASGRGFGPFSNGPGFPLPCAVFGRIEGAGARPNAVVNVAQRTIPYARLGGWIAETNMALVNLIAASLDNVEDAPRTIGAPVDLAVRTAASP
jgi:hypothetical protein